MTPKHGTQGSSPFCASPLGVAGSLSYVGSPTKKGLKSRQGETGTIVVKARKDGAVRVRFEKVPDQVGADFWIKPQWWKIEPGPEPRNNSHADDHHD